MAHESFILFITRLNTWQRATFGPRQTYKSVLKHIRLDLDEIDAAPGDIEEWADLLILAFSGANRAGHTPAEIIEAMVLKHNKNTNRKWPDWRSQNPDEPIEHIKTQGDKQRTPEQIRRYGVQREPEPVKTWGDRQREQERERRIDREELALHLLTQIGNAIEEGEPEIAHCHIKSLQGVLQCPS